jgi:branched-chain amino acid transport system ATP-binding protein
MSAETAGAAPGETFFEVSELTLHFGGIVALDNVSFRVPEGRTLGVVGPNGAGKTTMLNCIMRIYRYKRGDVTLRGKSLRQAAPHQISALGVGRTFQGADYFEDFTARDFVLLSRINVQRTSLVGSALGLPAVRRSEREEKKLADENLERFGLQGIADTPLKSLPYGTRKVLDIVRVMLAEPQLLLLDEPTSGTTAEDRESLITVLSTVKEAGLTTIVVDHDVKFVSAVSEELLVLSSGQVLAFGQPEEVLSRPDVIAAYVGI